MFDMTQDDFPFFFSLNFFYPHGVYYVCFVADCCCLFHKYTFIYSFVKPDDVCRWWVCVYITLTMIILLNCELLLGLILFTLEYHSSDDYKMEFFSCFPYLFKFITGMLHWMNSNYVTIFITFMTLMNSSSLWIIDYQRYLRTVQLND